MQCIENRSVHLNHKRKCVLIRESRTKRKKQVLYMESFLMSLFYRLRSFHSCQLSNFAYTLHLGTKNYPSVIPHKIVRDKAHIIMKDELLIEFVVRGICLQRSQIIIFLSLNN